MTLFSDVTGSRGAVRPTAFKYRAAVYSLGKSGGEAAGETSYRSGKTIIFRCFVIVMMADC